MKRRLFLIFASCLALFSVSSCFKDVSPENYYTFRGETVASFLEKNQDVFSSFIEILQKADIWGEMKTYGNYTCFAPTNEAIKQYLEEKDRLSPDKRYASIADLSKADCDTLSWTHLIRATYFIKDVPEGSFPSVNINDRFLTLSFDSVSTSSGGVRVRYCINKNSHIIEADDTVQNGVVHVVDKVINFAGDYIYDMIQADPNIRIFSEALRLVGLQDTLKQWIDETYIVGEDSVEKGFQIQVYNQSGGWYDVWYWGQRKTCFTFLIEPDSVYRRYGINTVNDLIAYAKNVYDESFPEDAGLYGADDYTNPKHPLRRFVSYHMLPFYCGYSNFNTRSDLIDLYYTGDIDPEDYFSTFDDHTFLRVSTNFNGNREVYVNKRGREGNGTLGFSGPEYPGVRILTPSEMAGVEQEGRNGLFHYIDGIIAYSKETREEVLNRRLRIDWTTISPDFLTSGARHRKGVGHQEGICFKQPKNFHLYSTDCAFSLRSPHNTCYVYEANAIDIVGNFDFYIKLPPVPVDGTYELRISYRDAGDIAGVVQNFLSEDTPTDWKPLGIPTDLRMTAEENPNIGWKSDESLRENGGEEAILSLDKALRNRGYMKSSDAITTYEPVPHRDKEGLARRILTTQYFYANRNYYLRLKLVLDNPTSEITLDYMEWVPKHVFDGNEDRH
ncbi:MAG: fasciclin domain-containing protein [Bacteroidaceae bacterium]|nr:fasciclin domain-containing protein [Bacteroidaceae bacterium]